MLNGRSLEKEWLDLGPDYYTQDEYEDCLEKLGHVGEWLGGDAATFSAFKKLAVPPASILDVGCGAGIFAAKLARRYPAAKVVGIDLNPQAIAFASRQKYPANLKIELRTSAKLAEPKKSYDVVLATLMCHHLTDSELAQFIQDAREVATKRVIINDLHRHMVAYFLFKGISPLLFRNRLINHDGPISVRRGFKHEDWVKCLEGIGLKPDQYSITWHFAFRWIVSINCEVKDND